MKKFDLAKALFCKSCDCDGIFFDKLSIKEKETLRVAAKTVSDIYHSNKEKENFKLYA